MRHNKKIKILFLIENLDEGGAEKVLRNLVNRMDQTKFDITVQTVWPCEYNKYIRPGIRYRCMYRFKNRVSQLLYRVEAETGLAYRCHVKDDYDIEVAYLECGPTKVIAKSTNKNAKKVAWVHSDFSVAHDRKFVDKTKKHYEAYDKVVCVSQKCLASFRDYYGDNIDSVIVHNVVDITDILKKSNKDIPEGFEKKRLTICSVGRLTAAKNYNRLVSTCIRLIREGFLFDTWIVGEGELRGELEQKIKDNEVQEYIKLIGFQENPYPYMKLSDLLVCSSNFEGYSTFITEGMVLGKPIITTDCSGMNELLDDYETGMIVENNDEAFYSGLKQCLLNMPVSTEEAYFSHDAINENELFFASLVKEGK